MKIDWTEFFEVANKAKRQSEQCKMTFFDLKSMLQYGHSNHNKKGGMANEYWETLFFSIDGFSAA